MVRKGIDGLLQQLILDRRFRSEFEANRDRVLQRFDLADQQREAMRSFDVGGLAASAAALSRPCPPAAIV